MNKKTKIYIFDQFFFLILAFLFYFDKTNMQVFYKKNCFRESKFQLKKL